VQIISLLNTFYILACQTEQFSRPRAWNSLPRASPEDLAVVRLSCVPSGVDDDLPGRVGG